jgi:hypothetical protein
VKLQSHPSVEFTSWVPKSCVSQTFHHYDKIPKKTRKERFILLTVSKVSLYHGGEGSTEQSGSPHCGQEAERMPASAFSPFPFHSVWFPTYRMMPPTFSLGLPRLINPLWKHLHRHTQRLALLISYVLLSPLKVPLKIGHHIFLTHCILSLRESTFPILWFKNWYYGFKRLSKMCGS